MEANVPALRVILRVEGNGAVCRARSTTARLPILLISREWREVRSPQGNQQCWPPLGVQLLIVAVFGTLLGIAIPMLMGWLGY